MKTVAITGAEGNIGSQLRKNLAGKYHLRLISLKPIPGEDFDIFYGVSDNPYRFFDIEHAQEEIGYEPQDSSAEKREETKNKS